MENNSHEKTNKPTREQPSPTTFFIILTVSIVLLAFCYFTWSNPDFLDPLVDADTSGRGSRKIRTILGLIYNRVAGTTFGIFGGYAFVATSISVIFKGFKKKEIA